MTDSNLGGVEFTASGSFEFKFEGGRIGWEPGQRVSFSYEVGAGWVLAVGRIRMFSTYSTEVARRLREMICAHMQQSDAGVFDCLCSGRGLEASGTPPKIAPKIALGPKADAAVLESKRLAALDFIAPAAGNVQTSSEGGLGWNEGERIIFQVLAGRWELTLGVNRYQIHHAFVDEVHRKLVELRDAAVPPKTIKDPYALCQDRDRLNSLTPARAAVHAAFMARKNLRQAVRGYRLTAQRRHTPNSLAEAADILRPLLKELSQLVEQLEKRSKL